MEWDEAQHFPRELSPKLAALGLMGIQFPEEFGGAAMSAVDYCICIEELARVDPSVCLSVAAHNGLGAAHIAMFGTEEQKQKYLAPLARGEQLAAWGLTEASSGSDAAAMRTTAVRDGDGWVHQRHEAVHHPRPHRRPDRGHGGHQPGQGQPRHLRLHRRARHARVPRRARRKTSSGCAPARRARSIFENCRVPASQLLGAEGQGFINALQVLDAGRIGIAALAVGLAQGAYEAARGYAFERKQFGQPIGDVPEHPRQAGGQRRRGSRRRGC